MLDLLIN